MAGDRTGCPTLSHHSTIYNGLVNDIAYDPRLSTQVSFLDKVSIQALRPRPQIIQPQLPQPVVRQHRVCRAARLSAKLGRRSRPEIRPQAQKLEDLTRKVVPRALPAVGDVIQPVGICLQKLGQWAQAEAWAASPGQPAAGRFRA